ncbi:MAG: hypothetical protein A2Y40_05800 [Candidatus Margulisbacteria bacterium GWF2_35_9]|nr:MAG: hypothetical protein A2Y40_05800 [Candidatus Margulisbacteria bacterium GWF2_35_9]
MDNLNLCNEPAFDLEKTLEKIKELFEEENLVPEKTEYSWDWNGNWDLYTKNGKENWGNWLKMNSFLKEELWSKLSNALGQKFHQIVTAKKTSNWKYIEKFVLAK